MKKAKAAKPKKSEKPSKAEPRKQTPEEAAEEEVSKGPVPRSQAETRENTVADTPSDGRHKAHDPAEAQPPASPIETDKPKEEMQGPPEPPPKPVITYEVLDSTGTDDQFEYVRVNVKVIPPFNGFDQAIITVPCPIHNSKGHQKKGEREQLIKEKALWKVNSHVGQGAHQFNAEDVQSVEEQKEA